MFILEHEICNSEFIKLVIEVFQVLRILVQSFDLLANLYDLKVDAFVNHFIGLLFIIMLS